MTAGWADEAVAMGTAGRFIIPGAVDGGPCAMWGMPGRWATGGGIPVETQIWHGMVWLGVHYKPFLLGLLHVL